MSEVNIYINIALFRLAKIELKIEIEMPGRGGAKALNYPTLTLLNYMRKKKAEKEQNDLVSPMHHPSHHQLHHD